MTPVRLEPEAAALRSRVKHSTAEPLRSREKSINTLPTKSEYHPIMSPSMIYSLAITSAGISPRVWFSSLYSLCAEI